MNVLREFEKAMELEPVQVEYTEFSILDSVDLTNATKALSFSSYETTFDKEPVQETTFDKEDVQEATREDVQEVVNKKSAKKKQKQAPMYPFKKPPVLDDGPSYVSPHALQLVTDWIQDTSQYLTTRSIPHYNNLVNFINSTYRGGSGRLPRRETEKLIAALYEFLKYEFNNKNR